MKKTLIIVLLFGYGLVGVAQSSPPAFAHPQQSLHSFVKKLFNEYYVRSLDSMCRSGFTMVKFKVSKDGKLIEKQCTAGTPKALSEALIACIGESQNYWIPAKDKDKPIDSKILLLPVFYSMTYLCGEPGIMPIDSTGKINQFPEDFLLLQHFEGEGKVSKSLVLGDMYKSNGFLDCYLIKPLIVMSGVY